VSATIEGEGRPAPCEVEGESSAGRATGATPYEGGGTGLSEGESRAVAAA